MSGQTPHRVGVRFQDWDCDVEFRKYGNGQTALVLRDASDGEEVAVATVNIPGVMLGPGEVLIKDYSENDGMLAALENAGIVTATGRSVESGFVRIPVCELLVSPQEQHRGGKRAAAELNGNDELRERRKARDRGLER